MVMGSVLLHNLGEVEAHTTDKNTWSGLTRHLRQAVSWTGKLGHTCDVDGLVHNGDELEHVLVTAGTHTMARAQPGLTHAAKMHQSLESSERWAMRRARARNPQDIMAREVKVMATPRTER